MAKGAEMGMAAPLFLISSALLSLLSCSCGGQVVHDDRSYRVVTVDSLIPSTICSPSKARGRNSLQIVHRHGPCHPQAGSKPDHLQALAHDSLRVASIQATVSSAAAGNATLIQGSEVSVPAQSGTFIGTPNYVVTLGFGTPKKDQTVVFDTGSTVCWIQCRPCAGSCYQQQQPIFDPSASSAYRNISCSSSMCTNLNNKVCSAGNCVYGVNYGDGSFTQGFLATDTLTLTPTNVFQNFVFGCGQNNQGLFGNEAGLVGLGRNSYSLVSQTARKLGNVFSYCLPRTSSTTGYLTLGKTSASSVVYTRMLPARGTPYYFIDLIGISVGLTRLPVSSTVFRSVGTILDSGTVITRLPPSAYGALRSAFRSAMSRYPLAQPAGRLDTCYDFSKTGTISYPPITFHYDGVDITLGSAGVFVGFSVSQVCLAFLANTDPSDVGIIGNIQQRTYEVIYDIGAQKIGFAAGTCS